MLAGFFFIQLRAPARVDGARGSLPQLPGLIHLLLSLIHLLLGLIHLLLEVSLQLSACSH